MGLLLSSIGDIGLQLQQGLMLTDGIVPGLHLLDAPMGSILSIVRSAATTRAVAGIAMRRDTFQGCREVEECTVQAPLKWEAADRRTWLNAITGAVWAPSHLVHVDADHSGRCRMCGGSGDIAHIYFDCPGTSAAKTKLGMDGDALRALPSCLSVHGIAPTIPADCKGGYGETRLPQLCVLMP